MNAHWEHFELMAAANRTITVVLAGDVMTGRGIDQVLRTPSEPTLHEGHVHDARDYVALAERVNGSIGRALADDAVWARALVHLRRLAPDLFIVNLETAVTTSNEPWPDKGIHYRMHPANVGCLRAGGVHVCALANNHVLDWGRAGLDETLRTLQAAGLRTAGAGADENAAWAAIEWACADGTPIRLLAVATTSSGVPQDWSATASRSGIALLPDLSEPTAQRIAAALAPPFGARALKIVSIHWGDNWVPRVPDAHRRFAQRLIDLGAADIVHGHSSHHPLPIEVYHDRLILYGCGDLINDYEGIGPHGSQRSDVGCLYATALDAASGRVKGVEIVPLQLRRFRLGEPDAAARQWALGQLNDGASPFRTRVLATPDHGWVLGGAH